MKQNRALDILIAEDNEITAMALDKDLREMGHRPITIKTLKEGLKIGLTHKFDLAFIDLDLDERQAGFKIIPRLKENGCYCVILSAHDDPVSITKGYDSNCDDYLTKPLKTASINKIINQFYGNNQAYSFKELIKKRFITQDYETIAELQKIENALTSDTPIIIRGDSGTGKTNLAKLIHEARFGDLKNFADFNASTIPENLIESELFGHKKGSFSGATSDKKGYFEKADGGTLFIDEVTTMSMRMQEKILKAIEDKAFYPVGSNQKVEVDFKLVSATCENIHEAILQGRFREDLYYRLDGLNVTIHSLRERQADIKLLLDHAKKELSSGRGIVLKERAESKLLEYHWPGNTRELFNVWQSLSTKKKPIIDIGDLPNSIINNTNPFTGEAVEPELVSIPNLVTKKQIKALEDGLRFPDFIDSIAKEIIQSYLNKGVSRYQITLKTGIGRKKMDRLISEMGLLHG